MQARPGTLADAASIARIYNEGIEEGTATFETRLREPQEIERWFDGRHPIVVAETDGKIVAFAAASDYRPRPCYAQNAEFSVYVCRSARRRGAGRLAMAALIEAAGRAGYHKLVSRVFVENVASRALLASLGFREVGIYKEHGRVNGTWRDVVIVELLLVDG